MVGFLLPFREAGRVLIMIELQLKRIAKRPAYTIGRLSIRRRTLYRLMQAIDHRDEGEPVFIEIE